MRVRNHSVFSSLGALAIAVSGCLTDPEEVRYSDAEAEPARPVRMLGDVPPPAPKTCSGATRNAADGLIDDLEDGDTRSAPLGGRTGYWWVAKADRAVVTTPAGSFASSDAGADGSKKAVRFAGKTDKQDQWGAAVGVGFLESGFYDASKYAGVAFKIKASKPNLDVRMKLPDASTHPDGGVCSAGCWNAFGKDLVVGQEWQNVVVLWSELAQQPNWGEPRPPSITVGKVKNIEWAVNQGVEFDLVVDEIHFVECG